MKIFGFAFVLALAACSGEQLSIAVLNIPDYAVTGDLRLEVCSVRPLDIGDLAVNLYVTENREWSTLDNVQAYDEYVEASFAGFPGDISNPFPVEIWHPSSPNCYEATLTDIFLRTEDWLAKDSCPFKAIIIVAAYRRGEMNGAHVFECHP